MFSHWYGNFIFLYMAANRSKIANFNEKAVLMSFFSEIEELENSFANVSIQNHQKLRKLHFVFQPTLLGSYTTFLVSYCGFHKRNNCSVTYFGEIKLFYECPLGVFLILIKCNKLPRNLRGD